jgi:hypothetical protein
MLYRKTDKKWKSQKFNFHIKDALVNVIDPKNIILSYLEQDYYKADMKKLKKDWGKYDASEDRADASIQRTLVRYKKEEYKAGHKLKYYLSGALVGVSIVALLSLLICKKPKEDKEEDD